MKTRLLGTILILVAFATMAEPGGPFRIMELPRPNSGTFAFQQAEARKSEILTNTPSPRLERADVDCCIHIEKNDTITVYNHFLKTFPAYSQARTNQTPAEVKELVAAIPRDAIPVRVLITSDVPLHRSTAIHELLKQIFVPSIQLLYVTGSEPRAKQGGI